MAASVVSAVTKLGELLIQEAVFLSDVREQVEELQNELERMRCFLKDAEAKQLNDERVHNWVREIREVAHETEDAVDTYIYQKASNKFGREGWTGAPKRFFCIVSDLIDLHRFGKKFGKIKNKITSISESRPIFGIQNIEDKREGSSSSAEMQQQLRRTYSHVVEEDVTGLEQDTKKLVAKLVHEEEEEGRQFVVSIVGMGGLGKTTLAKQIYHHDEVKRHFDCYAWIFISQRPRFRDILLKILKDAIYLSDNKKKMMETLNEDELVRMLYRMLQTKLYLVVLDDLWKKEDWDRLRPAFPKGKTGSKIMITTRNKEVALSADPYSIPHEPRCLTPEKSWELLCKKAFRTSFCPFPDLEKMGKEMVANCGGLPLAIVVLGGLLATKKSSPSEWKKVHDSIDSIFTKDEEKGVMGILALSYHDLPYELKPCFLYFGVLPEDFQIRRRKLIQLWIAEGFISGEGKERMEVVAKRYLEDLVDRCMVQMAKAESKWSWTGWITCNVHDLMRDLCVQKSREQNFIGVYPEDNSNKLRRQAIHFEHERYVSSMQQQAQTTSHLRSLLFFENAVADTQTVMTKKQLSTICRGFKLLRVLDLQGSKCLKSLPAEIGSLIHLRYLGLSLTGIKQLPSSIGNLLSLQFLYLDTEWDTIIPNVIWKMENLRHLYVNSCGYLRVDTLSNLQSLNCITANSWVRQDLSKLTHLRKLWIKEISTTQVEAILKSVIQFFYLRNLSLYLQRQSGEVEMFQSLSALSSCHDLLNLTLSGKIEKLPEPHEFPEKLGKLFLQHSLLEDPFLVLGKLPNLKILVLFNSYVGKQMVWLGNEFPLLEFLHISFHMEVEEWRVEEGAMPRLRILNIGYCKNLRMVPKGLQSITSLQQLKLYGMRGSLFMDKLQGEDRHNVQHIPSVLINETAEQRFLERGQQAPTLGFFQPTRVLEGMNNPEQLILNEPRLGLFDRGMQAPKLGFFQRATRDLEGMINPEQLLLNAPRLGLFQGATRDLEGMRNPGLRSSSCSNVN
ncbi:PREDICTED: putative disease resistance protein At1g50180 [Nelumbo nucifera]|uniref:Disease resistance protein At1g50180 n=2 Tax=Nelumbo nucifera TaxID=4432 RepID=A0A822ZCQ6_NELNU|nr:PREDICTED: putative disease resistance protein At1g50180 [Nelumbo nucifera]DAD39338.1 TPA_asm: hypothetical protein HUJ06_013661 [Nelumbo nucifera]